MPIERHQGVVNILAPGLEDYSCHFRHSENDHPSLWDEAPGKALVCGKMASSQELNWPKEHICAMLVLGMQLNIGRLEALSMQQEQLHSFDTIHQRTWPSTTVIAITFSGHKITL